jgi:hypothetical protein
MKTDDQTNFLREKKLPDELVFTKVVSLLLEKSVKVKTLSAYWQYIAWSI